MHIDAHLDLTVVPLDTDDEITILLEIAAPTPDGPRDRPPATLQIVLDRSGSMGRDRLPGAQRALLALVDRLDPADNFGLVTFDDVARVEIPAAPLTDKTAAKRAIAALTAGGMTDLSSGLLRGVQEARRAGGDSGATLLVISDGHTNTGIVDHDKLARIAADARHHGVSTTTLGYGLVYDERLMTAIADGGAGSALHAEDPDAAGRLIAAEAEGLLSKVTQATSLTITPRSSVTSVLLYGGLPASPLADSAVLVELGDFYAAEQRKVLIKLAVPGIAALGPATVAELALTYVDTETLTSYTTTVPISVNVVPGDEAAKRLPNPVVRAERLFQDVQDTKRQASDALLEGDVTRAMTLLSSGRAQIEDALSWAPNADELALQAKEFDEYIDTAQADPNRVSKQARSNWHQSTRRRGRPDQR
ncbi:vWA domain-containing protein [Sphaerimonospora thailandensis]|uniref:VWFA domain-containing protein n=1 Tax=Sphaerimonospora thailandensis TaxID=795644 RepID=A0A8J3RGD1_9ACTN|nr:VWA domain-containing protein [Sphaerimonospora thailandensis]GIH71863.1 hypothetical protein Mth01_41160 [Sphaerimonospora thailandensis]